MKRIIIVIFIFCCIALLGLIITLVRSNEELSDILTMLGRTERDHLDSCNDLLLHNDDVFIRSNHFIIHESEIELVDARFRMGGVENSRGRAIEFLLRREVLYNEALSRGFYSDNAEVMYWVNLNIEMARAADNFESVFMVFLEGVGMTDEEYWNSQADVFRKELTISKFITAELESLEREFDGARGRLVEDEVEERLQVYLQGLVDNYIISQGLEWAIN